jgi:hypothetical protein
VPCFVLTHQPHEDFITTGLTTALGRAKTAASGKNVLAQARKRMPPPPVAPSSALSWPRRPPGEP